MDRHMARGLRLAMGLGAGLGLMAGAALLAALPQARPLTNAEIMQRARALGMERISDMPRVDPALSSARLAQPQQPPAQTQPRQSVPSQAQPQQNQAPARERVSVIIWPTMPFSEVVLMLKAAGAIDDSETFLARAKEMAATTRIKYGVHVIRVGATYDEILEQLTAFPPPTQVQ